MISDFRPDQTTSELLLCVTCCTPLGIINRPDILWTFPLGDCLLWILNGPLFKIDTLSQCSYFLIAAGRGCCRSLNVLLNDVAFLTGVCVLLLSICIYTFHVMLQYFVWPREDPKFAYDFQQYFVYFRPRYKIWHRFRIYLRIAASSPINPRGIYSMFRRYPTMNISLRYYHGD